VLVRDSSSNSRHSKNKKKNSNKQLKITPNTLSMELCLNYNAGGGGGGVNTPAICSTWPWRVWDSAHACCGGNTATHAVVDTGIDGICVNYANNAVTRGGWS
jgi:hypothetical protein